MDPQKHKVERRPAAILTAEVGGYSCLMNWEEVMKLHPLNANRWAIDGLITMHGRDRQYGWE